MTFLHPVLPCLLAMDNDIGEGYPPFGPSEMEQIPKIAKFQVQRVKAYSWALRDIKFLTYDDTNCQQNGYDSDDDDGMLEFALRASEGREGGTERGDKGKQIEVEPSPHQVESECHICSTCPEFPHKWKPTKFRLFRPRDVDPDLSLDNNCYHFVAVSYCWPVAETDSQGNIIEEKRNYEVRDLDGTVRPNRALDHVIDRAVDVANSFGLRMIWIDQECLPQPTEASPQHDVDEQQIGVQAMDILYSRAMVTAGLHSVEVSSQSLVNAIHFAIEPNRGRGMVHDFEALLDFLDQVSQDRWYERAWVVQEALSAGSRLILVFQRASGIYYPSFFRQETQRFGAPRHSLDREERGLESQVLCIPVTEFRELIKTTKQVVGRIMFQSFDGSPASLQPSPGNERAQATLKRVEKLHPALVTGDGLPNRWSVMHSSGIAKQDKVEAAGALTLLRTRGCRDVRDRIAIMANMCGYDVRLDTNAVERQCKSLRVALLALSILNGDFSLLVPEVYSAWENPSVLLYQADRTRPARDSPSWLHPFDTDAGSSDHVTVRSVTGTRIKGYTRSDAVFDFPAYLWKVEGVVDLTPVKVKWKETYDRLKCVVMTTKRLQGDTDEEHQSRLTSLARNYFQMSDQSSSREVHEASQRGSLSGNEAGIPSRPILLAKRIQTEPPRQDCLGRIFFDILRCLINQAEIDPKAIGVANSIWQSMRVDELKEDSPLPDEVSDELFNHPDVISRPFETLKFDESPDLQYSQVWLFDRVMSDGYLWVGRYKRSDNPVTMVADADSDGDTDKGPDQNVPHLRGAQQPDHIESSKFSAQRGRKCDTSDSILDRELGRQMLAVMLRQTILSSVLEGALDSEDPNVNLGSMTAFGLLSGGIHNFSNEERRTQTLVSVFDVDGPCLVATVYDSTWETMPHPDLRSMSVCWKVEEVQESTPAQASPACDPSDAKHEEFGEETKQHSETDGPCQSRSPRLSLGEVQALEDGMASEPTEDEYLDLDKSKQAYRVLDKVRGMWQIMELPSQSYKFV